MNGRAGGGKGRGRPAPRRKPVPGRAPTRNPRARHQGDLRAGPGPGPKERGLGGEQVEGRHAVAELLAAGRRRVVDVWVDEGAEPAPILERIGELAARRRVPVRAVSDARLAAEARTDAPQGVLAHARPLVETDFDELCRLWRGDSEPPFLLALDGVTDPQNLGALLRTAEAAGVTGAVLPRHRAVHVTPAVTKAAAGAVEHVPMAVVAGLPAALARARELGLWVVGLDPGADESLFGLPVADEGVMVVLGSEGRGLSRLALARCDSVVRIPLRGSLASLNVAAAGALALFEVSRRRAGAAPPKARDR